MLSVTSSNQDFADSERDAIGHEKAADKTPEEQLELHRRLNLVPQMLSVMEPDGRFTWVNDFVLEYLGVTFDDLNSENFRARVLHPDDFHKYMEERQTGLDSGVPFMSEQRMRRHDGQYRWFLVHYRPLKDATGRVLRWYGGAIDIEDRKRAEEALRRSEAYLAESQRLTKTGSWANIPDGPALYWSAETFRIWGFDPQKGLPDRETVRSRIHPDDLVKLRQILQKAYEQKADYTSAFRYMMPDGTVKHIEGIGHPVLNADGDVVEFMGTMTDVTERKRAEESLRQSEAYLAEGQKLSHTGSWAVNILTGEIIHSSEEHCRLYGFDPEQGIPSLGKFVERFHPEDGARVLRALKIASRTGKDFDLEYRIVLPDSTIKFLYGTAHPVSDSAGSVIGFVGTIMDVTESRRAEEERERLRRSETELIRALHEQMVNTQEAERIRIAGELHDGVLQQITSLTLRLGKVRRLVPPDSEAKAAINRLQQELMQIGTDVRHLSHELHPALLHETGLPDALSAYCEEFSKIRGLSVSCETDESVRDLSPGAALCLYRIAQEALGNAAKHAAAEKIQVRLTRSNGQVCLTVSDDGIGFDCHGTGKPRGLGLINMRERALQLHGTFEFESYPGRGTRVTATVPFCQAS